MANFCSNCGNKLDDNSRFCNKCGTAVANITPELQQSAVRSPPLSAPDVRQTSQPITQPAQQTAQHNIQYNLPPVQQLLQANQQLAKPRRPIAFRVIACLLIFALVVSITLRLTIGMPTAKGSGIVIETASAEVSVQNAVATLSGVQVDANVLNLTDGAEKPTVSRHEMSVHEDSGLKSVEYDVVLGNKHRLNAPLSLTIPYDKNTADGGDVAMLHYDSDYELWIPLVTTDNGDGTVTASLNSLSPVRLVFLGKDYSSSLFYVSDMNTPYAKMNVNMRWWDIIKKQSLDTAINVANDFLANGNTNATTSWLSSAADDVNTVTTYYTLFGAAGDATASLLGDAYGAGTAVNAAASKVSKGIGAVSLIIAGTQLAVDSANPNSAPNTTAVNLMKNLSTNAGTIYGLATDYSSAALSISFFGVAVFGYGLDVAVEYAKDIQEDTVKAICEQYCKELDSFDEQEWYKLFVDAYLDAWQNGKGTQDGANQAVATVKNAIDEYAEKFWNDIYKDGNDTLTFAVAEAGCTNYFTPTENQKTALINGIKKDMYERFEYNVIPWIRDYMTNEMRMSVYASLCEIAAPFNEIYGLQIQENPPQESSEFCKYNNSTIRVGTADSFADIDIPETWSMKAPDDENQWAVGCDFTMMSYIIAGMPDTVLLFSPENKSISARDCDDSRKFTLNPSGDRTVVVELYGKSEPYDVSIDGEESITVELSRDELP